MLTAGMVYFSGMEDVKTKKPALEKAVKKWVKAMDKLMPTRH